MIIFSPLLEEQESVLKSGDRVRNKKMILRHVVSSLYGPQSGRYCVVLKDKAE
jgi:hypothetical protein